MKTYRSRATFGFSVLVVLLGFMVFPKHVGATPDAGPDTSNPNIYYTVSGGSKGGSSTGGNLLYSPTMDLKFFSTRNGGFTITFSGGAQCPSAGYDSGSGRTNFALYKTNPDESIVNVFYGGRIASTSNDGASCSNNGNIVLSVPSVPGYQPTNVYGHKSIYGTPLYVYYLSVYMPDVGQAGSADGPLNVFKISSPGVWFGPKQSESGDNVGYALLGRPSYTNNNNPILNDYHIKFGVPCDLTDANPGVTLKWFDADEGTDYQRVSLGMKFELWEYLPNTNATPPTKVLDSDTSGISLGGEGSTGTKTLNLKRGYRYEWIWRNVTNKNGVRLSLPYDSTNFDFLCQPPPNLSGVCDVSGTGTNVPGEMISGQQYDVAVVVYNNGLQPWANGDFGITDRLGSGADNYNGTTGVDPRSTRDNRTWSAVTNAARDNTVTPAGTRIVLTGYNIPGNSGLASVRIVKFRVTAPAVSATQTVPFWWQMVREGPGAAGNGGGWYGQPCKKNIVVKVKENRPYIQIEGSDVISGANIDVCNVNNLKANKASIKTNGYHGNYVLNSLNGTSNAQYGVFATGDIGDDDYSAINTFRGNFGYRRNPVGNFDTVTDALFASINLPGTANTYGHFYSDNVVSPPIPCVDISTDRAAVNGNVISGTSAQIKTQSRNFIASSGTGVAGVSGDLVIDALTVPVNAHKTIIVDGNVTITGNVVYQSAYTEGQIPYLKIIAKNVYVQANSQIIDANLVSVPRQVGATGTFSDGILDTCSNMGGTNAGQWPVSITTGSCRRATPSLLINGSVVARRILWKRTFGTLGAKADAAIAECYLGNYTDNTDAPKIVDADTAVQRGEKCAAELIKFSPEAYLAEFAQDQGTLGVVPQSSQELPPIY